MQVQTTEAGACKYSGRLHTPNLSNDCCNSRRLMKKYGNICRDSMQDASAEILHLLGSLY